MKTKILHEHKYKIRDILNRTVEQQITVNYYTKSKTYANFVVKLRKNSVEIIYTTINILTISRQLRFSPKNNIFVLIL